MDELLLKIAYIDGKIEALISLIGVIDSNFDIKLEERINKLELEKDKLTNQLK